MVQNEGFKLFVSYSHMDNKPPVPYIDEFKKHMIPLRHNGLIDVWSDSQILAGSDLPKTIDAELDDSDIVLLFLTANYFESKSCMKEKEKAMELRKKKGITVVPLILDNCGWQEYKDISRLKALPKDGKAVSLFDDKASVWQHVCDELKKTIEKAREIQKLRVKKDFEAVLEDTQLLEKAHDPNRKVLLSDIFVYPELDKYDDLGGYERRIDSKELLENILDYPKITIAGEAQSGKTSLCKVIFKGLRDKQLVPVYISSKKLRSSGRIADGISKAFSEQYEGLSFRDIDPERIVPIVDDFYFVRAKEIPVKDLSKYPRCIVIVDDIFTLNIKDDQLLNSFSYFRIRDLKPSLRNQLIRNWVMLSNSDPVPPTHDITFYKTIDEHKALVESILGKVLSNGIMPAYPFFILSIMLTASNVEKPLNQEITSQGYCYQAFIYFYLRRQGIRNDEVDFYINFLTEIAYYCYKKGRSALSSDGLDKFKGYYLKKYNLPIKWDSLLDNIHEIFSIDSLGNYSFRYDYLYYFFVAKYLADHFDEDAIKIKILQIVDNLQINENAYITIFIAHHSAKMTLLQGIEDNALRLFYGLDPATLLKKDLGFFDEQTKLIVEQILPSSGSAEQIRAKQLEWEDELEQLRESRKENEDDTISLNLRKAVKTVEVMGHIIKNRAGSLERTELEEIFENAMNVHLRMMTKIFEIMQSDHDQNAILLHISERLAEISRKKKRPLTEEEIKNDSSDIFWNMNFFIVCNLVHIIIRALGSSKLTQISDEVCDRVHTPASFLVKHGILMWCKKNMEFDEIVEGYNNKEFSEIAKKDLQLLVSDHCSLHSVSYQDRQRIAAKLEIPLTNLLLQGN